MRSGERKITITFDVSKAGEKYYKPTVEADEDMEMFLIIGMMQKCASEYAKRCAELSKKNDVDYMMTKTFKEFVEMSK